MRSYKAYLERAKSKHDDKFDASDLAENFIQYFESGQRVEVSITYSNGETEKAQGYVGVTTGWKPSFLIVHNRRSLGGSTLLSPAYRVTRTFNTYL